MIEKSGRTWSIVRFEIQQNLEAEIQFVDQQQLLQKFEEGAMAKCECHTVENIEPAGHHSCLYA